EKDKEPANFSSLSEAVMARDSGSIAYQTPIRIPFRGETRVTTLGRLFFNEVFPEDFPFQNSEMTKKRMQQVMAEIFSQYGQEETARIADNLKQLGYDYATRSGLSMGMTDFSEVPQVATLIEGGENKAIEISQQYEQGFITNDERYRLTVENWMKTDTAVQDALSEQFVKEDSAMSTAVNSGARGNIGQVKTAVGLL